MASNDNEPKNSEEEDQNEFNEENFPKLTKINEYIPNHTYLFRICLLGDSNVGKTSLLTRYVDGSFKEKMGNTIGVDFRVVTLKYNDITAKVHIWDTAGQERFKSIAINYFRNSHGFLFIYDITSKESFTNISNWIELAVANNKQAVINFLIGNKIDLENKREVSENVGRQMAKFRNFTFFETSAAESKNVDKMFEYFTYRLINYFEKNKSQYEQTKKEAPGRDKVQDIPTSREKEGCNC